ncbi:hypothetical protein BDN70DRAFT_930471 [Pholiota conissans]|uniref:Uncharacterized protein n=1 Tax=Pholiota conissans TaxID=109636 RepID=A0A9P6D3A4_9AGAR|nr:hypothetical protein BDN70DRAFT_930471 [Pholiota conissans]
MILQSDGTTLLQASEGTYQTSISGYVQAASLGILCWDILDNIPTDFKLIAQNRVSIVAITYVASRIGSFGDVLASTVVHTAPVGHCILFDAVNTSFYPISLSLSGLLFFFRLRAIYNQNPIIVSAFFLLWLGLVASTVLIPVGVHGGSIGDSTYCRDATAPDSVYAAIMAPLVHDTAVFIAISYRLMQNAYVEFTFKKGFKMILFGEYLPNLTKSLFIDGQRYYLMTLISNIVTAILIFSTSLPVPLRAMLPVFNVALTNIMACRVYRRTKTGLFRESELATTHMKDMTNIQVIVPRQEMDRVSQIGIIFCEDNAEGKTSFQAAIPSRPTSKGRN